MWTNNWLTACSYPFYPVENKKPRWQWRARDVQTDSWVFSEIQSIFMSWIALALFLMTEVDSCMQCNKITWQEFGDRGHPEGVIKPIRWTIYHDIGSDIIFPICYRRMDAYWHSHSISFFPDFLVVLRILLPSFKIDRCHCNKWIHLNCILINNYTVHCIVVQHIVHYFTRKQPLGFS